MTPENWKRLREVFHHALDLAPGERDAYLDAELAGSPDLRREADVLLSFNEENSEFLETPAINLSQADSELTVPSYAPGDKVHEFVILKELGKGSFARVYLAHQVALNRSVALKASAQVGEEGQRMASLEHQNIVRVFSQSVDETRNCRLLCMQYVPGTTLERVLRSAIALDGPTLLREVEAQGSGEVIWDPAAYKDREALSRLNAVEVVAWIGARLAEALAYAHARGVLHLDVKPGNILINPFGRPLLTDFNVAVALTGSKHAPKLLGGTFDYMAPEQKQLFEDRNSITPIDARADIYSLALVMREMLARATDGAHPDDLLAIQPILDRCLEEDPRKRYANGTELANALEGFIELREIRRAFPPAGWITKSSERWPFLMFGLFTLFPQLLGSATNIGYNKLRIADALNPSQQALFYLLVVVYNIAVYPPCVGLLVHHAWPVYRALRRGRRLSEAEAREMRESALELPKWVVWCTSLGWLPGALFFPLAIHFMEGPLSLSTFGHFFISFALSWLIALSYSHLYVQFVALRVLYPRFCAGSPHIRQTARAELEPLKPTLRLFHFTAGFIPLIAAALIVLVGPDSLDRASYSLYRWLVTLLLSSGMVGLYFAVRSTQDLSQTLFALTARNGFNSDDRPRR